MIWFWSDFNTCRKARGSATFASTGLSNCHNTPADATPPTFSFPFFNLHIVPLSLSSPSHLLHTIPPLEDTHIYPEGEGCWVLWRFHRPTFPFSSPLSDLGGDEGNQQSIQRLLTKTLCFLFFVNTPPFERFGYILRTLRFSFSCIFAFGLTHDL